MSARRHLSILFADLVGYTALSERLDPEILADVQREYQSLVSSVVETFGGCVASFSGDGILAFFGFPTAHENDAERAIYAALEIVARVQSLALPEDAGQPCLNARAGLHTGTVVIGSDSLHPGQAGYTIVGMGANLAARLQAEALPNSVVASSEIMALVQGLFDADSFDPRPIRGFARPIQIHRIHAPRNSATRSQGRLARGALRMIGRRAAMACLREQWRRVTSEGCHVVQIVGQAGIGKSRLVQEFTETIGLAKPHLIVAVCAEMFASTPLYPVVGMLWSKVGLLPDQDRENKRARMAAFLETRGLGGDEPIETLQSLLGLGMPGREPPPPAQMRRRQFDLIAGLVEQVARSGPSLLWIEDVHWLDPSSAELIVELVRRLQDAHLLVIMTQRAFPGVQGLPLVDETVLLHQLEPNEALDLAKAVPGAASLPQPDLERAIEIAEGVPLFIEQLVFSLLRQQDVQGASGAALQIPLSLSEMMSSCLDRVAGGRLFAQTAACVGRIFDAKFLALLMNLPDREVSALAQRLVEAEILRLVDGEGTTTHAFSHALLHQVAYESTLRTERRRIHGAIAVVLSRSDLATPPLPEVLAHHLSCAGDVVAAVNAWIEAGAQAARRSADVEALAHYCQALGLLGGIVDLATRLALELRILAGQIGPLSATKGSASPELDACCRRGLALSLSGVPSPLVFPFLYGQCTVLMSGAKAFEALDLAQQFLALSERQNYGVGRVISHRLVGMALLCLGDLRRSRDEVDISLHLYEQLGRPPDTQLFGQNALVHGEALLSLALFCLGDVDAGISVGLDALRSADELRHPHSTVIALGYVGCWVLGLCGASSLMNQEARRMIRISDTHQLGVFRSMGEAALGWSLCQEGDLDQGIPALERAIADLDQAGFQLSLPGFVAILADAKRQRGRIEEARRLIARACATVSAGNVWLEPEVLRLAALLAQPDQVATELSAAAARARQMHSPVLELRCLRELSAVTTGAQRQAVAERIAELAAADNLAARVQRHLRGYEAGAHRGDPRAESYAL